MSNKYLSVHQAADELGSSAPYVAMLAKEGKVAGAVQSDGRWMIPADSIATMKEGIAAESKDADYRKAAKEAGMYDVPESDYLECAKRDNAPRDVQDDNS